MTILSQTGSNSDYRLARGAFVRDALKAERWSIRAAAMVIGMSNTALSDRCRARAPFLAEDIEAIAIILKRDPVEFYGAYLRAGTKKGPTSEETGPQSEKAPQTGESLRGYSVHPPGLEPGTHWIRDKARNTNTHPRSRAGKTGPTSRKA